MPLLLAAVSRSPRCSKRPDAKPDSGALPVRDALIDGEAVTFLPDGHSDFAALRTKEGGEPQLAQVPEPGVSTPMTRATRPPGPRPTREVMRVREELKKELAIVRAELKQKREELRDFVPPPYLIQREIDAEKEHMRRMIEAYEAHEKKLATQIFVLGLPRP
jgi:hypothetical protein